MLRNRRTGTSMIVDRKQRKWAVATLAAIVVSAVAYAIYAAFAPNGPSGGSPAGLIFGIAAASIFVFECVLTLRKKFAASLIGRVQTWLRAHIWLGILSLPLALMHSGFRWGNGLAAGLMWVTLMVVLTGIAGIAFQQYLPRKMKESVERETIFDQIPYVVKGLLDQADEVFDPKSVLQARYNQEIRPYLLHGPSGLAASERFQTQESIQSYFEELCTTVPSSAHGALRNLADLCEERRQLAVQRKLHRWLHCWLVIHVPLSFGLLVLTVVHAVLALRY